MPRSLRTVRLQRTVQASRRNPSSRAKSPIRPPDATAICAGGAKTCGSASHLDRSQLDRRRGLTPRPDHLQHQPVVARRQLGIELPVLPAAQDLARFPFGGGIAAYRGRLLRQGNAGRNLNLDRLQRQPGLEIGQACRSYLGRRLPVEIERSAGHPG